MTAVNAWLQFVRMVPTLQMASALRILCLPVVLHSPNVTRSLDGQVVNARADNVSPRSVIAATVCRVARVSTENPIRLPVVFRVVRTFVKRAVMRKPVSAAHVSRHRVLAISAITMAVVSMTRIVVAPNA